MYVYLAVAQQRQLELYASVSEDREEQEQICLDVEKLHNWSQDGEEEKETSNKDNITQQLILERTRPEAVSP